MKIFLVNAPSQVITREMYKEQYPLGIAYLGACLEEKGHKVSLFNYYYIPLDEIWGEFLDKVEKEQPEIIGFSILTPNRTATFELIKAIKEIYPKIKIVVGGIHCSTLYKQILENYPVDLVCKGEGEEIICDIVENLVNYNIKNLEKIPNIAFSIFTDESEYTIVSTPPPKKVVDINKLPFPMHKGFLNDKSKLMCISTSRGCAARCVFCSASAYWKFYRARTAKNVVDEIEYVTRMFPNIKEMLIYDDTFTLDNNRVIDICREMIKRDIQLKWTCAGRVHPLTLEMLQWMKLAGCEMITFGVESGSPKILKNIKKNITVEQIEFAVNLTRLAELKTELYFITGLPGETEESINETISLLKKLKVSLNSAPILEIYPNTEVYQIALDKKLITEDYWITQKDIPYYTCEHSLDKLTKWKIKTVYESMKNISIFSFIWIALKKGISEPKYVLKQMWLWLTEEEK